jgi:hypothetical protein
MFGAMDLRTLHTRVRSSRYHLYVSCASGLFLHYSTVIRLLLPESLTLLQY